MYESLLEAVDFISQPWPWWMGGFVIGTTLFLLFYFGKEFGLSANLRIMCAADGAGDYADFFDFDWGKQGWNLMVALGALFGAYMAANYFGGDYQAHISPAAVDTLNQIAGENILEYGNVPLIPGADKMHPEVAEFWNIYSWKSLFTVRGLIIIVGGGF